MTKTLKLAVYCRVSTKEQRNNETIERQLSLAPKEIERLGLLTQNGGKYSLYSRSPLTNETDVRKIYFVDDGFNLESLPEGTAIYEMLELIKAGEIHAVFVDSTDRILRSLKRQIKGYIQDTLFECNVDLFTHQGRITDGFHMDIVSAVGSEDKRATGRKLHGAKVLHSKKFGSPVGVIPFGFSWDKRKKAWELVEEEAKIIRWIVALTAGDRTDDMPESLRLLIDQYPDGVPDPDILSVLEDLGYNKLGYQERCNMKFSSERNPSGKFGRDWLHNIFRKNRFSGETSYNFRDSNLVGKKGITQEMKETVDIKLPVVVTKEQWDKAQSARAARARYHGRHVKQKYLLKQMCFCANCGATMSSRSKNTEKWNQTEKRVKNYVSLYYVCSNDKKHKNPCPSRRTHNTKNIDPLVWDKVSAYILNPDFILANEKSVREDTHLLMAIQRLKEDQILIERKMSDLDSENQKLVSFLLKGTIEEKDYLAYKEKHRENLIALQRRQKSIQTDIKSKEKILANIDRVDLKTIKAKYSGRLVDLNFEDKRKILRAVVKQVVVSSDNHIRVDFKLPQ